jgi:hypothetical protein
LTGYFVDDTICVDKRRKEVRTVDKDALCGEIRRNGLRHFEVAKEMGMSPKTFSQKLNKNKFGINDAEQMIRLLGIKNPAAIFFDNNVT